MAWQHLLFGTAVCLTACTAAAGSVAVTGVDAAAAKNIVLMLEPTGEAEPWRLDNSSIRETAARALRPYGYYSPSIDVTRDGKSSVSGLIPESAPCSPIPRLKSPVQPRMIRTL